MPNVSDLVASLVRTYVPMLVGLVAAYLDRRFGIVLDEDTTTAASLALAGVVGAAYYTLARLVERRYPKVGLLLGVPKAPMYPAGR